MPSACVKKKSTDSARLPDGGLQFADAVTNLRREAVGFGLSRAGRAERVADLVVAQLTQNAGKPPRVIHRDRMQRGHLAGVMEVDRVSSRSRDELLLGIISQ